MGLAVLRPGIPSSISVGWDTESATRRLPPPATLRLDVFPGAESAQLRHSFLPHLGVFSGDLLASLHDAWPRVNNGKSIPLNPILLSVPCRSVSALHADDLLSRSVTHKKGERRRCGTDTEHRERGNRR